ncbi:MAG: AAA family ATPase [Candidatus Competibacteraceae bacterium]|nr:AAA family ATPase [Candidatus Competibacteraceae bacterium]
MKPKLPIGLQNLREMRTQGYVYIDKTAHVARLAEQGKYYFLARPRRFGKSLLVDTLAEAFAGSRELFEGLYLEQHWDWSRKYPVLRFDFGSGVLRFREELDERIGVQLAEQARQRGLVLEREGIASRFEERVLRLAEATGQPVVLLIDEYDKPILDNLSEPEPAAVLAVPGAHYHAYGKAPRPGRKVGHLTLRAADPAVLAHGLKRLLLRVGLEADAI